MTMSWLRWMFAAAMIGVALFHLVRVVASRSRRRSDGIGGDVHADLTHAAMGVVMTIMLLGALAPATDRTLAVLFGVPLVWFAWRAMHSYVMDGPHAVGAPVRHVVGCTAMVYMLLGVSATSATVASMPGMSMHPTSPAFPIVGATLLVATLAVAAWAMLRPRAVGLPAPPALAAGCQLAMNAATVYMLVAM